MACFPSLPAGAVLLDGYRGYPQTARPLRDYYQALLRRTSRLAVAERELITAYVPGLNARGYGYGVHQVIARTFGAQRAMTPNLGVGGAVTPSMSVWPG
jgi:CubicO group peptidase (beta-lactamase class C family)